MFKKQNRLSSGEFETYFKKGTKKHSPFFQCIYTPYDQLKVAVVVPKKVIKTAVGRNKLRRQIYHVLRSILIDTTGVWIIMVKKDAPKTLTEESKNQLIDLVGGVIKKG